MKKLLIALFNAPNSSNLKSWASWNITSIADIEALPETDDEAWGLAGNLCIDAHDDGDMTEDYYNTYVAPLQKCVDEYFKPKL